MLDLALATFVMGLIALGLRRPFLWVLTYLYVDIVAPQKISYFLLASIPLSPGSCRCMSMGALASRARRA